MKNIQPLVYEFSLEDIKKIARECRKKVFGVNDIDQPFKLDFTTKKMKEYGLKLAREHNLNIKYFYPGKGHSLYVRSRHDFIVSINDFASPQKENRQLAHELGHIILHLPDSFNETKPEVEVKLDCYGSEWNNFIENYPLAFQRFGSGDIEWQAKRFARELLMPEESLDRFMKKHNNWDFACGHYDIDSYYMWDIVRPEFEEKEKRRIKEEKSKWQIYF